MFSFFSYGTFSYVYYAMGGVNEDGNRFIYSVLDWSKPNDALVVAAGALVGIVVIHVILSAVYVADVAVAKRCGADSSRSNDADAADVVGMGGNDNEAYDDEEEGGRGQRWATKSGKRRD